MELNVLVFTEMYLRKLERLIILGLKQEELISCWLLILDLEGLISLLLIVLSILISLKVHQIISIEQEELVEQVVQEFVSLYIIIRTFQLSSNLSNHMIRKNH
jgi:hypothetical protein